MDGFLYGQSRRGDSRISILKESCGQCTPCREGTGGSIIIIASSMAKDGKATWICCSISPDQTRGKTICALGDAAAMPVRAFMGFRGNLPFHVANKRCMVAPGGYSAPAVEPLAIAAE